MVEETDADEVSGILEPFRDIEVLGRGLEPSGWMVVAYDDGTGPVHEGIGEDLARMHDRCYSLVVLL